MPKRLVALVEGASLFRHDGGLDQENVWEAFNVMEVARGEAPVTMEEYVAMLGDDPDETPEKEDGIR